jgi:hypothetical protein
MILEAVVTTLGPDDTVNIAPMGPHVDPSYPAVPLTEFELRPYVTSRTWANLQQHPEGVLHVIDDVLLLAQAAVGAIDPVPPLLPASHVRGRILRDACRAYEFRLVETDTRSERIRLRAAVVGTHRLRDCFGFNRAMFAVVEAAILATRTAFLPLDQIEADYARLAILVEKTAGPREREAFEFLRAHLAQVRASRDSA